MSLTQGARDLGALLAALILALPLAAAPTKDRAYEVGTRGARLRLDESFQRKELEAGLGRDQFLAPDGIRLVCLEQVSALPGSVATRKVVERSMEGIRTTSTLTDFRSDAVVVLTRDGRDVATGRAQVKTGNLPVHYRFAAIEEGGLVYLFLVLQGGKERAELLDSTIEDAIADFSFPSPESEWAKASAPRRETVAFDWGRVSLSYSPILWPHHELAEDAFFELSAVEDRSYLVAFENPDTEVGERVDDVIRHFEVGEPVYEMDEPIPRTVAGLGATELRGRAVAGESKIRSLIFAAGPSRAIEIRLDTPHLDEVADILWEDWLAGLAVEVFPEVTAFPEPEPAAAAAVGEAPPEIATWIAGSRWLGTVPGTRARGALPVGDGFVLFGDAGVHRLGADRSVRTLRGDDEDFASTAVAVVGEEILIRYGGQLHRFDESAELVPIEPRTRARAPLGESLLEVRAGEPEARAGFTGLPTRFTERLVEVTPAGVRHIAPLAGRDLVWLVPSADRSAVLIASRPRNLDETSYRYDRLVCSARLTDGTETPPFGEWDADFIAPAAGGWLVTGSPVGRDHGVHYLRTDGSSELLISGYGFLGVTADATHATVSGAPYLPAQGIATGTALYRVELESLRRDGPSTMPFGGRALHEIAAEALRRTEGGSPAVFTTRESIGAFAALCREISAARCGRPVPRGETDLDRAFQHWIRDGLALSDEGFILLTALLSETLLDRGAEWVGGPPVAVAHPRRGGANRTTAGAWARSAPAIVGETLYDQESYWQPIAGVLSDLEGRLLLLGTDDGVLTAALDRHSDADLHDRLAAEDPGPLLALARERAENLYLRAEIYQHLAARGRNTEIREIAAAFLAAPEPLFIDVRADLAARLETSGAAELSALIADLGGAIARFPRAPVIYELLGEAYRRRAEPSDDRRARLCFQEVLALQDQGELADRARRALESLPPGGRAAGE